MQSKLQSKNRLLIGLAALVAFLAVFSQVVSFRKGSAHKESPPDSDVFQRGATEAGSQGGARDSADPLSWQRVTGDGGSAEDSGLISQVPTDPREYIFKEVLERHQSGGVTDVLDFLDKLPPGEESASGIVGAVRRLATDRQDPRAIANPDDIIEILHWFADSGLVAEGDIGWYIDGAIYILSGKDRMIALEATLSLYGKLDLVSYSELFESLRFSLTDDADAKFLRESILENLPSEDSREILARLNLDSVD